MENSIATEKGCRYKNESETICSYLSEIVQNRDDTMTREFKEQNKIIRDHNKAVIDLLTTQGELNREVQRDVNTNLKPVLEKLVVASKNHEVRIWALEQKALLAFISIVAGIGLGLGIISLFIK